MSEYDGTILFKDWLPDQPDFGNPGLTEAHNVLPIKGTYAAFEPLAGTGPALPGQVPTGAFMADWGGGREIYVASTFTSGSSLMYKYDPSGWITKSATLNGAGGLGTSFAQFDDIVFATDVANGLRYLTTGSATSFQTLVIGPVADRVGVIGQFLVLGKFLNTATSNSSSIRWSAIDNPLSFPDPGSATAIASQAGEQFFNPSRGPVTYISGGDQYGLVFQTQAINRLTYVGGSTVFQIDCIDDKHGAYFPNSVVSVLPRVFFISSAGFFVTDGVSVRQIGLNKASRKFVDELASSVVTYRVWGAYDGRYNLIYWCYSDASAFGVHQNKVIIYNIDEDRFTHATTEVSALFTGAYGNSSEDTYAGPPNGFQSGLTLGTYSGVPGTATLITGELEPNPGGYAGEFGVKPLVDVTTNAVTVAMGTRNDLKSAVTYSGEVTANSRSGFSNFRTEARFHRARLTIAGTFNAAQGIQYQAEAAGYT